MKKILLTLAATALCAAFASTSFGATIYSSTYIGGGVYSPSAKVGINVVSVSTSYAAQSCHLNGNKEYGTGGGTPYTQDTSKILSKTITDQASNTDPVCHPTAPASATALSSGTWE